MDVGVSVDVGVGVAVDGTGVADAVGVITPPLGQAPVLLLLTVPVVTPPDVPVFETLLLLKVTQPFIFIVLLAAA